MIFVDTGAWFAALVPEDRDRLAAESRGDTGGKFPLAQAAG